MKVRKRLSDEQAKSLGLKLKPKTKSGGNPKYFLTQEQLALVSETNPNDYAPSGVLSALDQDSKIMDIDSYCSRYNLPRADVSSYKLITHTGVPFYNIVFREQSDSQDLEVVREVLSRELKKTYKPIKVKPRQKKEAVLKWADLHFGAHIRNLVLTPDYDSEILLEGLLESVAEVNNFGFKKVHVHIQGDLIESFSGLNHVNSWMSMDKNEIGSKAVILCCDLLEKALSEIENLGEVKVVAGNHDRTSKANDEDVKGQAAELICWGLKLKGFNVEFHPYIITHLVDGINHINLHGDKGISKKHTSEIIWKYGQQGCFNFVFEAHLHSVIEKLSSNQRTNFKVISDDNLDYRRQHLPSFFTGNYYSESLGFSANPGYLVVWDNGQGNPNIFNGTVHVKENEQAS